MSLVTFVTRYRDELIADLRLDPNNVCPTCIIRCVDDELPEACERGLCIYTNEEYTLPTEILKDWTKDVLREAYRAAGVRMFLKWADRFDLRSDKERLLDMFHYHHIYRNYDLEELSRILDALNAADVRIEDPLRWRNRMTEREYAVFTSLLRPHREPESDD